MKNENLLQYTKEELIDLIEIYSKNQLAMDGVWFQSVEQKCGMDEAMLH
jgi:CTP:phosphocholine cytidylyltransferase-like protein